MIDALCCFLKIGINAKFVIRYELLLVARDQWEPGALDLHHNAVALKESVIIGVEIYCVFDYLVGGNRFRLCERIARAGNQIVNVIRVGLLA